MKERERIFACWGCLMESKHVEHVYFDTPLIGDGMTPLSRGMIKAGLVEPEP